MRCDYCHAEESEPHACNCWAPDQLYDARVLPPGKNAIYIWKEYLASMGASVAVIDWVDGLLKEAVEFENAVCAKLAEEHPYPYYLLHATDDAEKVAAAVMAESIATSIRARKP